ncbi:hypothetical protein DI53_2275 [Sphingobacterium deserti]|uniref:Uncharacterized protein n=1 Tax=Sphingobacterium deserti TaxID=1229276 RepID=A0A0B8T0T1_9SPHI|nr:hypothetical protein DI53_2275 [Sphingobacterium deserti]
MGTHLGTLKFIFLAGMVETLYLLQSKTYILDELETVAFSKAMGLRRS